MVGQSAPSPGLQVRKFWEAASALKGSAAIQRDLSKLEKWFSRDIMKFSKIKQQVPHLGRNNSMCQYMLGTNQLESKEGAGIPVDKKLTMS